MQAQHIHLTEEEITQRLANAEKRPVEELYPSELLEDAPKPAAVLLPLLRKDHTWHLLYTRRTETLAEHSGQVAFPGGRSDPHDVTPEVTALRETQEEIALHPRDVRLLGRLNRLITITNYCVTPVVGVIPWPYEFRLHLTEVSRVFTIPLAWLADPENHDIRYRHLPSPFDPLPVIYFKPYEGELLWGVSARITLDLLEILKLN